MTPGSLEVLKRPEQALRGRRDEGASPAGAQLRTREGQAFSFTIQIPSLVPDR